jgi:aspartate/methionine/tyrosine aminotransferase
LIGSKELVAWLPTLLQSKSVNFPEIAYPTYRVGAILAGASEAAVAISPEQWPQADLTWVNSPSNPTGRVHSDQEYVSAIEWARANNSVLVSDECYLEFGDNEAPTSILQYTNGNNHNILA